MHSCWFVDAWQLQLLHSIVPAMKHSTIQAGRAVEASLMTHLD